jgi:hypothetical protein
MQDKTINDVLLALYRTGESRVHVAAFMALMGIPAPNRVHDRPLVRGKCKRLASSILLCTTSVVANAIQRVARHYRKEFVEQSLSGVVAARDKGGLLRMALGRMSACGELIEYASTTGCVGCHLSRVGLVRSFKTPKRRNQQRYRNCCH